MTPYLKKNLGFVPEPEIEEDQALSEAEERRILNYLEGIGVKMSGKNSSVNTRSDGLEKGATAIVTLKI